MKGDTYIITVTDTNPAHHSRTIRRLALLLKRLGRGLGLKCVDIRELPTGKEKGEK